MPLLFKAPYKELLVIGGNALLNKTPQLTCILEVEQIAMQLEDEHTYFSSDFEPLER